MADNSIEKIGTDNNIAEEENGFDIRTIIEIFILNWQWFALSTIIFLCGALIFLRYKSPVYQVSAKMLIKDEQNSRNRGNQMLANMQDLGFMTTSTGIDNEVEILQSNTLSIQSVKNLKLYVEYKMHGRVKNALVYNTQPVNVDLDARSLSKMDESDTPMPIHLRIEKTDGKYVVEGYTYTEDKEKIEFSTSFATLPHSYKSPAGIISFTKNNNQKVLEFDRPEYATITSPKLVGMKYAETMEVEPTSKVTSIAQITLKDKEFHRANDFLKELAFVYNEQANEDKNEIAVKTEEFINERIEKIDNELGKTEEELEEYKRNNSITELKLDATQTLTQTSEYSTKYSETKSQIQLMDYLRQYIENPDNRYQIIPSNVGLEDKASTSLIDLYNKNVLDRNRLLRSASEIAPQVQVLT